MFRRARLVARQFKSSVDMEQTFAPTSMMVIPKTLINLMLNVFKHFVAMTLDIKDAFLMAAQPEEEKAYVHVDGKIYKLNEQLPHSGFNCSRERGMGQDIIADDTQSDLHHSPCG